MTYLKKFKPHPVDWTQEKISRIWDFYSRGDNDYFSKSVGDSIIKLTKKKFTLQGKVIDFGCGSGHLIEKLIKEKMLSAGFDLSEDSLHTVEEKFKTNPYFLGTFQSKSFPTKIKDSSFDVVFFIETIEHLLPEETDLILKDLNRIIKKNGHVVLTTRNEENLEERKVICPDCGAIYHRKQHISSFDASSLSNLLKQAGFSTVFCQPVLLTYTRITWLRRLYQNIFRQKLPTLFYIGKKD